MIVIAGSAQVKSDRLRELLSVASDMAEKSRAEDGCSEYRFAVDIDEPNTVRLFEQWVDEAALSAHFATPHFAEFSAAIGDALDGAADFTRYEVTTAGPLFA